MSDQYLILHKVRGEPSFDIAEMMEVGDEAWWIIPTSGHRAYPYRHWHLSEVLVDAGFPRSVTNFRDPPPTDCQDHYQVTKENVPEINIGQLISGLVRFKRRF